MLRGFYKGIDRLYFLEESWEMIREYGILPEHFNLKIELISYEKKDLIDKSTHTYDIFKNQKITV